MSVFNGSRYLRESVESICAQTFADFEFLIIDDGSSDDSLSILQAYSRQDARLRILQNAENLGLTRSLNLGLRVAQGRYIARQDADDTSVAQRLALQAELLDQRPEIGLVGGLAYVTDEKGTVTATARAPLTDLEIRWQAVFVNPFFHTTVAFRREMATMGQVFYDETYTVSQDYALWCRILSHTRALNLDYPLASVRKHGGRTTHKFSGRQREAALEISRQQIAKYLPNRSLTLAEVDRYRFLAQFTPQYFDPSDLPRLAHLWQIQRVFVATERQDKKNLAKIRRQWLEHLLMALPAGQWWTFWHSPFLRAIRADQPLLLLLHVLGRITQRIQQLWAFWWAK